MLVTAILPTRGRPDMARRALMCILAQTSGPDEIIVIDDVRSPSFSTWPEAPFEGLYYLRIDEPSLGAKLNLACSLARGEYIVHFHDDDVSAPERIVDQVRRLQQSRKSVTNYRNLLFSDGERSWRNTNWPGGYGTSLAHRKAWWVKCPFLPIESEDWEFVSEAMRADEFVAGDAGELMHCRFSAASSRIGPGWEEVQQAR